MKEESETRKKLRQQALDAPKTSGVYLWKDETGTILYVGKAKSLKNRLYSYFSSQRDIKTRILVARASTIEYISTENEYEALLLENTLIKQHSPRYNINLKDGKTYPVIKITAGDFPRIYRTRRLVDDGGRYFGPFPNLPAIDGFLDFIKRNYRIRQCRILRKRSTPCLYYHIGRCSAPCAQYVTKEDYNKQIDEVALLLEGNNESARERIALMMREAAGRLEFEKAARLRDGLRALEALGEQNAVVDLDPEARDYIAWAAEGIMVTFAVLRMRSGKLTARDLYRVRSLKDEEEILGEFLLAFYTEAAQVPPHIFVPTESGLDLAEQALKTSLGVQTRISVMDSSQPAMAMALFNAREDAGRRLRERGDFPALEELQRFLSLPSLPSRIEGFDIAHIGGRLPVASLITFRDGNPDRKNYRSYRLKTTDGIIDDFASMREVTSRRYTRLLNDNLEMPDLILIDGGIGQVNAVQGVLDSLGLAIPVAGLAKQDEEIYRPGNSKPLKLAKRSDALRLLQRIRDETHRFATTKNQKLRTKENTHLVFEELPGIGPGRSKRILAAFGSLENLSETARLPDGALIISRASGIPLSAAERMCELLPELLAHRNAERTKRAGTRTEHTTADITSLAQAALDTHNAGEEAADKAETYRTDPAGKNQE